MKGRKGEELMKNNGPYTVYWVAGERDGETLAEFTGEAEAIMFARKFYEEHESEFDPCCGGVGIEDASGKVIVDW